MRVQLQLPPETERVLTEKAAQSGQTLEAYLEQLAQRDAQAANGMPVVAAQPAGPPLTLPQWSAAWRAWAASHATRCVVADDSRESIYAGRGE
jgi:hypothetical protein